MNTRTETAVVYLLKVTTVAIIEAVKEAGSLGAPAGLLYAALMSYGCSLETFNNIMDGLVKAGKLRRSNNLYFAV